MTYTFQQRPPLPLGPLPCPPYDRWLSIEGDDLALFCRNGSDLLVRFLEIADFAIGVSDRSVIATPGPDTTAETVEELYFNQVLPLLMSYDGELLIHASGVAILGEVAAFIGPSGAGKSTLATAFALAGYPFLTDDGLILDFDEGQFSVSSRRPFLRLRSDSAEALLQMESFAEYGKERVSAGDKIPHLGEPAPLAALFVLERSDKIAEVSISRLSTPQAVSAFMQHSFLLDVEDRGRIERHFDRLIELANHIPCFRLDYPRDFARLPGVIEAVTETLRGKKDSE